MPSRWSTAVVLQRLPSMRQLVRAGFWVGGVVSVGVLVGVLGWTEDRVSLEPAALTAKLRYDDPDYSAGVRIVNHSIRKVRIVNVPPL